MSGSMTNSSIRNSSSEVTDDYLMWDESSYMRGKEGNEDTDWKTKTFGRPHEGGGVTDLHCAFMMIFHLEQTPWSPQRAESIDLAGSNHNTSTFRQVCFCAIYQDFINYFGSRIDLLLSPPSIRSVKWGDLSVRKCSCVVCFGGIICHLASKYRGHMVGKQMSPVRPADAKSWQMTSGEASTVPAQTTIRASTSCHSLTPA